MCEIKNGAFVNRMWGDLGDGEVLAHFQYDEDARAFAKMLADNGRPAPECWFAVCCARTGKIHVYRPVKTEAAQ